jgi:hypothetical protein
MEYKKTADGYCAAILTQIPSIRVLLTPGIRPTFVDPAVTQSLTDLQDQRHSTPISQPAFAFCTPLV